MDVRVRLAGFAQQRATRCVSGSLALALLLPLDRGERDQQRNQAL
jgi:hypothetical protein